MCWVAILILTKGQAGSHILYNVFASVLSPQQYSKFCISHAKEFFDTIIGNQFKPFYN